MAATATITGVAGPAITVSAQVFTDLREVRFDCITNVVSLVQNDGNVLEIAITSATTITATKSGSTYTFTVS
jgi:hypothetical protein